MSAPVELPNWPALMPVELASAYLGMREGLFRGLTARNNVRPVDVGARKVLWRRRDLDALVDRLPDLDSGNAGAPSEQPLGGGAVEIPMDPAEAALARVRSNARGRRK